MLHCHTTTWRCDEHIFFKAEKLKNERKMHGADEEDPSMDPTGPEETNGTERNRLMQSNAC